VTKQASPCSSLRVASLALAMTVVVGSLKAIDHIDELFVTWQYF
jgi:hypothetical protein